MRRWTTSKTEGARWLTSRRVALIYAVCFGIGAGTHALDFVLRWPRPYAFAPLWLETFWSLLLPIDLTLVALLLSRFRVQAAWAGLVLMVADVAINTVAPLALWARIMPFPLACQAAFLIFILCTIRRVEAP